MKYDFHVHDALRVEYRVLTGAAPAPNCLAIARETRSAGGRGAVAACCLAAWGARVLLTGRVGADAHGQFLGRELQKVPNLSLEIATDANFDTPYAILIQNEAGAVTSLLSAGATPLQLEARTPSVLASHFLGVAGDESNFELPASTQNYAALLEAVRGAARAFHLWSEAPGTADDFASQAVRHYEAAFAGPEALGWEPQLQEIEALRRAKR